MMRGSIGNVLERLREWWAVDDPEERIDGPGEAYLDPAYNGRYTAERELRRLANAEDGTEDESPRRPGDGS